MPDQIPEPLPFRIGFDMQAHQVVVWMTLGTGPEQTTRRRTLSSIESLATAVAEHRYEAFLQRELAVQLARAGVIYLGADPDRLEAAVRALSDPASNVSVGQILHGTVPRQTPD